MTIKSFVLYEITYKLNGISYEALVIGKYNSFINESSPISDYGINQLNEITKQIELENYFQAYKILKKIKGLPKVNDNKIARIKDQITFSLNSKKSLKFYKQKVRIKLHGKLK